MGVRRQKVVRVLQAVAAVAGAFAAALLGLQLGGCLAAEPAAVNGMLVDSSAYASR